MRFSSRGGSEVYIILIVILGAFLLAGGQFILTNIVTPPVDTGAPNPLLGGGDGGDGSGSPSSTGWDIQFTKRSCEGTTAHAQLVLSGPTKGYADIQFGDGSSYYTYLQMGYNNPPTTVISLDLTGDYNTSPIRIILNSGGTFIVTDTTSGEGTGSGGTQKKSADFPATNCP